MLTEYDITCRVTVDDEGTSIASTLPNLNATDDTTKIIMRVSELLENDAKIPDMLHGLASMLSTMDNAGDTIVSLILFGMVSAHELHERQQLEQRLKEILVTLTSDGGPVQ